MTGAFRVLPFGTQADPQGSGHGRHSIYRSESGNPLRIKSVNGVFALVGLLKQINGVGTPIALTFLLTLEDPHRFRKRRDVGCYPGLQLGRRKSGESDPQMHITKEGDPYLRTLLVQGAQYILGPFGIDCDLRRWGLQLAERGGRNGKERAILDTARKLAVLLHHRW